MYSRGSGKEDREEMEKEIQKKQIEDMYNVVRDVLKNWWVILFIAISVSLLTYIGAAWMYHPIRVIGNLISVLEKGLRKLLCSRIPASEQKKKNERATSLVAFLFF